jgi:hypothetical protein
MKRGEFIAGLGAAARCGQPALLRDGGDRVFPSNRPSRRLAGISCCHLAGRAQFAGRTK